ncbi:hypothetical protein [Melittangium boletus]|uniref:Uncharacterized protein n=1 Tax=Melittangium boletus DSM 14713 TaxID=1294270 RepID=A0A250I902_9BACT|nr:hypothetical protein [Melittangium boletus]ATB27690.1 hypothetical protein MEBOL_001134 [Melittangium boletus DSM 14713]
MVAQHKDTFTAAKTKTMCVAQAPLNPSGRALTASSGAEAAARLKNEGNYYTANWKEYRGQDFLNTMEAHKDDPAFMRDMYEQLGPKLTSQLLDDAANAIRQDNHNTYGNQAAAQRALSSVAKSLDAMPPPFQGQVGRLAGRNHPAAALVLKHGASLAVKQGFLEGIKPAALGSVYGASFSARMAGDIIASEPKLYQHVADTWPTGELGTLMRNGLTTPPLADAFHSDWPAFHPAGLERMVGMAADIQGPSAGTLRTRVFQEASLALGKNLTGEPTRKSLVDNMKTLFKSDTQGLVDRLFNNNGSSGVPFADSQRAMGLFFRDALFAHPGQDASFQQFVSDFMGKQRQQMLDPARLAQGPGAAANELSAKQLGNVLGSVVTGYSRAAKDNGEQQAARKEFVGTLLGLATKPVRAGGPIGDLAKGVAEKAVTSLLSDFLNGGLKNDKAGMNRLMMTVIDKASEGARDFDMKHGSNVETALEGKTVWLDFNEQLAAR